MDLASLPLPESFIIACQKQGITSLYPPQEDCISQGLLEGKNLLISIPTASGKTLLAEMAMWAQIAGGGKCLYIVPLRALASEKYEEFSKKGVIRVGIATGDFDRIDNYLGKNDIIVATSEKADSLLRNRTSWLSQITCIVLDEVHLIGSEKRGTTLEMLITKLRYNIPHIQVIGLSATIGNPNQLAEWLDARLITSNWRPVDLRQGVFYNGSIRFPDGERPVKGITKHDDLNLCLDTLEEGGQCLVFLSSRRNAEGFAKKAASALKTGSPDTKVLADRIRAVREHEEENVLAECVARGVAFHHAGLLKQERSIIEEGFRKGYIEVVAATPTLAAGLNLPARRVIIRDYSRFSTGLGMVPIPVMEYHQMAGRAGRPHLDPYGEAVLLAKDANSVEKLFETFIDAEPEKINSQCAEDDSLCAHILSVIASGLATNRESLISFMERTFYIYQHPRSRSLSRLITDATEFLIQSGMATESDSKLIATSLGNLVSRLYINPASAFLIINTLSKSKSPSLTGMLHLICVLPDMQRLYVRSADNHILRTFLFKHGEELILPPPYEQNEEELWLAGLKTALVLTDWSEEVSEKEIENRYNIGAGDLYNIIDSGKWLINATERLVSSQIPDIRPQISNLVLRVTHGIKPELLPLITLHNIGRVRARRLYNAGYPDQQALIKAGLPKISRIIGSTYARQVLEEITGKKEISNEPLGEYLGKNHEDLTDIPGIGKKMADKLKTSGINSVSDLLKTNETILAGIIGSARTQKILALLTEKKSRAMEDTHNEEKNSEEYKRGQLSIGDFS